MNSLQTLPTDVLINIFTLLSIPDILNLRQTNKLFLALSKQSIVWINARKSEIFSKLWPCEMAKDDKDEEKTTRNAWRLGRRWASDTEKAMPVRRERSFMTNTSTAVSDIRFLVVHGRKTLLTVSKGIWSVLTLWDIDESDDENETKLSEWSPRGGLFTGLAINEDANVEEQLAVSIAKNGSHETLLLEIDTTFSLTPKRRIPSPEGASPLRALAFSGSVLALADDLSHTTIFDWATGEMAILTEDVDEEREGSTGTANWKHNIAMQVVFAHRSVLVVRARSLSLFQQPSLSPSPSNIEGSIHEHLRLRVETEVVEFENEPQLSMRPLIPTYTPIAMHSFGWVDGIDVVLTSPKPSSPRADLQVFVRAESDNPWRSGEGSIDVYVLRASPDFDENDGPQVQTLPLESSSALSPYIFPPYPLASLPTPRGSLRCNTVRAGSCSTALWVCPLATTSIHSTNRTAGLVVDQWAVDGAAGLDIYGVGVGASVGSVEYGDSSTLNRHGDTGLVDGNGIDIYGIGIGVGDQSSQIVTSSTAITRRGESLVAGVFPGPFLDSPEPRMKQVLGNMGSNGCTAMDYDEVSGRVAMGLGDGSVWVGYL
ncbi:hypothetical protein E1B28_003811 [Marasmius oreades]|uniref:F-box domain-containing protein n=1 Tax=Marasmius oreades TaxID=181124 RepID=A0A9P7UXB5_9AGAR|nr:uncharacterized protein E1B28_003811 [Marasmius oreades]KAG7096367.1 hypothetical protein E1B28_003811 [Marasmius oreades]